MNELLRFECPFCHARAGVVEIRELRTETPVLGSCPDDSESLRLCNDLVSECDLAEPFYACAACKRQIAGSLPEVWRIIDALRADRVPEIAIPIPGDQGPKLNRDWAGLRVRTVCKLRNGMCVLPKGYMATVLYYGPKGIEIEADACLECSARKIVTCCRRDQFEIVTPKSEWKDSSASGKRTKHAG